MIQGKGGRIGPDLSATGSTRSTDYIVESLRSPSRRLAQGISEAMKEFSQEYETVTVETAEGQKFMGVVLNEDHFTLQMMDTREQIHVFEKDKRGCRARILKCFARLTAGCVTRAQGHAATSYCRPAITLTTGRNSCAPR